ncbi:hypothetical protein M0Q28_03350 [Patescibacteria group bacterium]|jgi:hypothetical protein|nr:hypothetical protein [Patescibacteria group bacterium]
MKRQKLSEIPPLLIVIGISCFLILATAAATYISQPVMVNKPTATFETDIKSESYNKENTSSEYEVEELPEAALDTTKRFASKGEVIPLGSAYAPNMRIPTGLQYTTTTEGDLSLWPCDERGCERSPILISWSAQTNPEKELQRRYAHNIRCDQTTCEGDGDVGGRIRARAHEGYMTVIFWFGEYNEASIRLLELVEFTPPAKSFNGPWECISPPAGSAIGSVDYPVFERYEKLDRFLGGMFTHADCAEQGFAQKEITGIYDLGVNLGITEDAPEALRSALQEIGFSCVPSDANACTHWELNLAVPVENLLRLRPFAPYFLGSDCINCG